VVFIPVNTPPIALFPNGYQNASPSGSIPIYAVIEQSLSNAVTEKPVVAKPAQPVVYRADAIARQPPRSW